MEGKINACVILVKKPLRKKAFGRVRRCVKNVEKYRKETSCEDEMWTDMAHNIVQ
jgi:hypothetical protein